MTHDLWLRLPPEHPTLAWVPALLSHIETPASMIAYPSGIFVCTNAMTIVAGPVPEGTRRLCPIVWMPVWTDRLVWAVFRCSHAWPIEPGDTLRFPARSLVLSANHGSDVVPADAIAIDGRVVTR